MKLKEALDQVEQLSEDAVIFARKPWTLEADAEIGQLDNDLRVPEAIIDRGLEYFLEADVAKEVLGVFENRRPTVDERRRLLMYYAENDAYPEWVYKS